jgi:dGTPase
MELEEVKSIMLKYEENLSVYACLNKDAIRLRKMNSDIRPNYARDVDKILHSLCYTRYINKTQVFTNFSNDHISTRIIHVQLVSKIARTIGRALSLNEDLIEAISLGHDVGHVPFGHTGEAILNEISLKYDNTYFMHNVQSVRELMTLEDKNLTIQVLDGILTHNGEMLTNIYHYQPKTKEEFLNEYEKCYLDKNFSKKIIPMTLEGCVVRISDIIGYIGRDLEDAIRIGIIKREDIPQSVIDNLGDTNSKIVNTLIIDIVKNSLGKDYLKISDNIFKSLQELIQFNYKYIYIPAHSKEDIDNYTKMFNELFIYYKDNVNNKNNPIYKSFLKYKNEYYLDNTSAARKAIDFIAGMTDRYIEKEYKNYKSNKII